LSADDTIVTAHGYGHRSGEVLRLLVTSHV
jgi:hypothetical protein